MELYSDNMAGEEVLGWDKGGMIQKEEEPIE